MMKLWRPSNAATPLIIAADEDDTAIKAMRSKQRRLWPLFDSIFGSFYDATKNGNGGTKAVLSNGTASAAAAALVGAATKTSSVLGARSSSTKRLWTKSETRLWTLNFFLGTCALYASRVALPICAVAIAQEYGWNKTDSGTIMSCFFWGYAITQVIAGGVADLYGAERILPYSTVLWTALTFLTPQLFDFAYWSGQPLTLLLLVRVFTGIGQGFHLPSMASMVSRHLTASEKGRVFGISLAGSHLGTVVAGAVGSILLAQFGWRSLFYFVGALGMFWLMAFDALTRRCSHSSVRSRRRRQTTGVVLDAAGKPLFHARTSDDEGNEGGAESNDRPTSASSSAYTDDGGADRNLESTSQSIGSANDRTEAVPWGTLLRHSAFWAASLAQYCGANTYYTLFSWLPSYFADTHPSAKPVIYNVVPSLAIVLTSVIAPLLAARMLAHGRTVTFTRRVMECSSLIAMGICLLLAPFTSEFYSSLAMFTLAMAARGLHHRGVAVNPHDFAPNHTGSVFGLFNSFSAVTGFIGVYLAGVILQWSENQWSWVFTFTAAQCLLGAFVFAFHGTGNKII